MSRIVIGTREFETPVFIPSVSSYETSIPPSQALTIQGAIGEPISLASAFDLKLDEKRLTESSISFRRRDGVLLLDSGGYESYRYNQLAKLQGKQADWCLQDFLKLAKAGNYDLAFSFDIYPLAGQSPTEYVDALIELLHQHSEHVETDRLIPVVHLLSANSEPVFDVKSSSSVLQTLYSRWEPEFVAVPERELGIGIVERATHVKRLVRGLDGTHCKLHILGCGNPLSVGLLGYAGAAMMDGLEWCRTIVAPQDGHLHHFQQLDIFKADLEQHDQSAAFLASTSTSYVLRAAIHNLVLLRTFLTQLRQATRESRLSEYLGTLYGSGASSAVEVVRNA